MIRTAAQVSGLKGTYVTGVSGGNVVGYYVDAGNVSHGFLYNGTTFTTLDDPNAGQGAGQGTNVTAVSGNNVVGYYQDASGVEHGFLYQPLGTLGTTTWEQNETGYSSAVTVFDGTGPFGALTQSGLPNGLTASLSGSTITISGTPTVAGTFNDIQLSVTDANGEVASNTFSRTIIPAPTLGSLGTTVWEQNETGYSSAITINNGTGPFGTLTQSGLPTGLTASLSGSTITISGTPTASGTFDDIQLSVTDANGVVASGTFWPDDQYRQSRKPDTRHSGNDRLQEQDETGYSSRDHDQRRHRTNSAR